MSVTVLLRRCTRRGVALMYVLIAMPAFVGLVALGVDYAYVRMVRSELQNTIDAAALAGSAGLKVSPAEARKRAIDVAKLSVVNSKSLVLANSDIDLGYWDPTTKQFVKLSGANESKATAMRITKQLTNEDGTSVKLLFAPLIGQPTKQLTASAVGGCAPGADVVIVQDVTSPFSDELADAKTGDQALLDAIKANGGQSDLGVVAHTGWGTTLSPLRNVNTHFNTLKSVIRSINHCGSAGMPVCSGTDIAAGLDQGVKVFDDPRYVANSSSKAIVLVSDGEPTSDPNGSHPNRTEAQMLTLAQQSADAAWAKNIHVYIVFFNRTNSASAAAKLRTLPRGRGDFVQVTNAADLPAALESVTKKLPMQLVK